MRSTLNAFRIGSVPYLNAVPLTHSLGAGVTYLPPSELARQLHGGHLDAALLSVTEVMGRPEYTVLDGAGICSDGPVYSVILAHQDPLSSLGEIHLDPASCTSVNLLRVLLAQRGPVPAFRTLDTTAHAGAHRNVLLIGNPAIEFRRRPHTHQIWDLGAAWQEQTGLPFVYAVWALRRDQPPALADRLRASQSAGLAALPEIVAQRPEYDAAFRQAYLGGYIRYHLSAREKAGLQEFGQRLLHHAGRTSVDLEFV